MDGLLAPAALAAGLLAIPILITYMLKARRPRQVIPSTFLWRVATRNVAASRPWDRIRPSLLLLLQLLLLAALVLALARPFRSAAGIAGDHLVLVVDASGSMASGDQRPSRLGTAKVQAGELIATLDPGATVSVVAADHRPRVIVTSTGDPDEALRAVDSIETGEARADFAEAFLLAESLEIPGHPATIALISDGGLSPEELELVPPGTIVRGVGRSAENVAISGLEVGEGPAGLRAFVQVRNYSGDAEEVDLTLEVDDVEVAEETVSVPAGSSTERSFNLASGGRIVAAIDPGDPLPHDDRAFAVLERTSPKRILLVGPGNFFLENLLEQIPGADVRTAPVAGSLADVDLVVFDRSEVPRDVEAPALFIAPAEAPPGVQVEGSIKRPQITYLAAGDPLLDQVDLSELAVARTADVRIAGARTLVGSGETPMIATWVRGSYRRAFLGFALNESNLPLQVAFPILADHLLSWLTGSEPTSARYAGDAIEIPSLPGTTAIEARIPGARGESLLPGQALDETARAGFYTFTFLNGDEVLGERTVALSFPPGESDLAPRTVRVEPDPGRPGLTTTARHPIVAWVLIAALALLLLEWWWGHGRPAPRVPPLRPGREGRA